jgi:ketosteroid isomerase-like protein
MSHTDEAQQPVPRARVLRLRLVGALLLAMTAVACQPKAAPATDQAASPDAADVRELVQHYFKSWSTQDMTAYGECFSPGAYIWYVGQPAQPLPVFLEGQRQSHLRSPVPMTEDPLTIDVTTRNGLAHARVYWELHEGARNERGYDFFTLAKMGGRWQIIALVFNSE